MEERQLGVNNKRHLYLGSWATGLNYETEAERSATTLLSDE